MDTTGHHGIRTGPGPLPDLCGLHVEFGCSGDSNALAKLAAGAHMRTCVRAGARSCGRAGGWAGRHTRRRWRGCTFLHMHVHWECLCRTSVGYLVVNKRAKCLDTVCRTGGRAGYISCTSSSSLRSYLRLRLTLSTRTIGTGCQNTPCRGASHWPMRCSCTFGGIAGARRCAC